MDVVHKPAVPLPRVPEDWVRKVKLNRTINDQAEDIHVSLLEDEEYLKLLEAVYDEQAVEGSLAADNVLAAMRIRKAAEKMNLPIHKEKLATISKALGVVLRRYGVSRKERRNMIDGQVMRSEENGD